MTYFRVKKATVYYRVTQLYVLYDFQPIVKHDVQLFELRNCAITLIKYYIYILYKVKMFK